MIPRMQIQILINIGRINPIICKNSNSCYQLPNENFDSKRVEKTSIVGSDLKLNVLAEI